MKGLQTGILMLCAVLLTAGIVQAVSPEEKALSKEIQKTLILKDPFALAELIPRLMDEGISTQVRLKYCQTFLIGATAQKLTFQCYQATVKVLLADYKAKGGDPGDPKGQATIKKLVDLAMDRINREKELFIALLAFYHEVPDTGVIKKINKIIPRFPNDTDAINAVFAALQFIRVKESVEIINDIYYRAWKKTDEDEGDGKKSQAALMFYGRISGTASRSLESLTGQAAADAKAFNQWWKNNRGKVRIEPLESEKAAEKPAEKAAEVPDENKAEAEAGKADEEGKAEAVEDGDVREEDAGEGGAEKEEAGDGADTPVPENTEKDGEG